MTVHIKNILDDVRSLSQLLDSKGAFCFYREFLGLTEHCIMTDCKIHFIIPVKLNGDVWRIAYPISGMDIIPENIICALKDCIPPYLKPEEFDAFCVVQFGHTNCYYAFSPDEMLNTLDDSEDTDEDYGLLTAKRGHVWRPQYLLDEMINW